MVLSNCSNRIRRSLFFLFFTRYSSHFNDSHWSLEHPLTMKLQGILIVICFVITQLLTNFSSGNPLETLVRRNKPSSHSLEEFEKTCEMCGQLYGYDTTYDCMTDPSNKVFRLCLRAVGRK
ncbi:uncharacterized protein LOC134701635 [Mytilus trossulus]|uniref:uncharacterized protein LOC134701635 n=1 Tax=Mytilus trossulus TaxID=6551 RepID=UPI0030052D79